MSLIEERGEGLPNLTPEALTDPDSESVLPMSPETYLKALQGARFNNLDLVERNLPTLKGLSRFSMVLEVGALPDDHEHFPGGRASISPFYVGFIDPHLEGVWMVEAQSADKSLRGCIVVSPQTPTESIGYEFKVATDGEFLPASLREEQQLTSLLEQIPANP